MNVSASIPVTEDYREIVLAAGEADNINGFILVGTYLYGCTNQSPAKLIKIATNNFSDKTAITFANDSNHREALDMVYVQTTNLIYVLFGNSGATRTMVTTVHPSTLATADVINDTDYGPGSTGGSITSDGTYLYIALTTSLENETAILRYALSGFARTASTFLPFWAANCVRADGGVLFIKGKLNNSLATHNGWIKRLDSSLAVTHTVIASAAYTDFGKVSVDFAMSANHLWVGNETSSTGIIRRFSKADLSFTDVSTGILARCVSVCYSNDSLVWALFDNGKAVSIHSENLERRVYTLEAGGGYLSELVGESPYLYTSRYQASTKVERYHVPIVTPGILLWANNITATQSASVKSVAANSLGEVFAVGSFGGTGNFNGNEVIATGADAFVVKYTRAGSVMLPIKRIGGTSTDVALSIVVDSTGNFAVAGNFRGTMDLGNGIILTSAGSQPSIFVAFFSPAGVCQWARKFGTGSRTDGTTALLAVDSMDNIILAASFQSVNMDCGAGYILSAIGSEDILLVKLWGASGVTPGVTLWAVSHGGGDADLVRDVAVDSDDNIVITGSFWTSTNLGGGAKLSNGSSDIFLAKYSGVNGAWIWDKTIGGTGADSGQGVAIDLQTDNIIVGGNMSGTPDFGGTTLTNPFNSAGGAFLVAYNSAGNYLWGSACGALGDYVGIVRVNSGVLAITGRAQDSVTFGGGPHLSGNGAVNNYIMALDVSGDLAPVYRWGKRSRVGSGAGTSVAVASGVVIGAGVYQGTTDVDGTVLTAPFATQGAYVAQHLR